MRRQILWEYCNLGISTLTAIYLATFIGGISATGSTIAFEKLSGALGSTAPLCLPGRDQLNLGMLAAVAAGMNVFLNPY